MGTTIKFHSLTDSVSMHSIFTTFRPPPSPNCRHCWKDLGKHCRSMDLCHPLSLPPSHLTRAGHFLTSANSGASFTRLRQCTIRLQNISTSMFPSPTPNRNFVSCWHGQIPFRQTVVATKGCRITWRKCSMNLPSPQLRVSMLTQTASATTPRSWTSFDPSYPNTSYCRLSHPKSDP